jgi:uncharacterized protein YoxC
VDGGEVAAIIASFCAVVAVMLLVFITVSVTRTLTAVRLSVEEMRRSTLPVVEDLQRTVSAANAELQRVDGLLESAESVTATVDSASHLAYLAFSNPVIKAMALGTGTVKAAKALRRDGR